MSTVKPIADKARLKRTSLYNFIDRLVEKGLIGKIELRGRIHYKALDPNALIESERERLMRLERILPELTERYSSSPYQPRMSYYSGPKEVANIVREELKCKKEALYIWPGKESIDAIGGAQVMARIDQERIKRKIKVRTIRFRRGDLKYPYSANGPKFMRELRFAPPSLNVSMGLGIYDNGKVGFFSSKKEGFGMLIESVELQELMKALYESIWPNCAPANEGEG